MPKYHDDTHPVWAPEHNRAERAQETDAAWQAYHQEREFERETLALARRTGIRGDEARRFLTRQRASYRRHQAAQAREQAALSGKAALLCCGVWHPLVQLPLRTLCCGRVWLAWR